MINFNFIRFISVIFLITNLNAGIIYVSDSGDDESGDGSSDTPYLTIQKGIDEASAMDTVMVFDGIYTGGVIINDKQISLIGESITDTKINVPITEPNISYGKNTFFSYIFPVYISRTYFSYIFFVHIFLA